MPNKQTNKQCRYFQNQPLELELELEFNSTRPNLKPSQQSHQGGPSYNAVAYQPCATNNAAVYQPSAVNNAIASGVANGVAKAVANAVAYQPCLPVNSHH